MGSTTTFFSATLDLSLNCVLGVKVGMRAAVFYGFPYKLRPKLKIAWPAIAVSLAWFPQMLPVEDMNDI